MVLEKCVLTSVMWKKGTWLQMNCKLFLIFQGDQFFGH